MLPLATWNEWKALTRTEIIETLGTTELLHAFIHNYRDRNRPGSSGVVLDGYECRLTDDAGNVVEGAGRGHLHVRGGSAIPYYLNKPEEDGGIHPRWMGTHRRRLPPRRRGLLLVRRAQRRSFQVLWNVGFPAEVEDALARHAAVMEAAVIAEADDTGATIPAAYVLRAGNEPDEKLRTEIIAKAAESLPRFKQPKRIHFMDQLPRTPTGKVQRFKLRELARSRRGS